MNQTVWDAGLLCRIEPPPFIIFILFYLGTASLESHSILVFHNYCDLLNFTICSFCEQITLVMEYWE